MQLNGISLTLLAWLATPWVATLFLTCFILFQKRRPESLIYGLAWLSATTQFVLGIILIGAFYRSGDPILVHLKDLVPLRISGAEVALTFDGLSGPLAVLTSFVVVVTARFSRSYLHRDPGYSRFFLLLLFFSSGMSTVFTASTWSFLVVGWELVGVTSVLLIGFFEFREGPLHNAMRALVTYRICDLALFCAGIWLPEITSNPYLVPASPLPYSPMLIAVSFLIIVASLGKSAQFPAGAWLTYAMEGPTPSSAVFYGALSVHAGAYLLMRLYPLWNELPIYGFLVTGIGCVSAIKGAFCGRVRPDVKTQLAYATMAQLGIIFIEIGQGWLQLALIHMTGHALLRMFQLLRSPSVLSDFYRMGLGPARANGKAFGTMPPSVVKWAYRQALTHASVDAMTRAWIVAPVLFLARVAEAWESRLQKALNGREPLLSKLSKPKEKKEAKLGVTGPKGGR